MTNSNAGRFTRNDGRALDETREITFQRRYLEYAEGSCLVSFGKTKVLCTASIEDKVPPFLSGAGQGWVTAEYAMLPKSTIQRIPRDRVKSGRNQEIQRLIGRSMRSVIDMTKLGERTIYIDCDVIQADGGTRTASITGAMVALHDAVQFMLQNKLVGESPILGFVAAISVGLVDGCVCLDLDYSEDSTAGTDFNVVKTDAGEYVEVQGTAEHGTFSQTQLIDLLKVADSGIEKIFKLQREALNI